jgi:hypothetical protein
MTFDLRPELRTFLLADATISTAVAGSRVHPVILPQGTNGPAVPALVYNTISEITDHVTTGASGLVMVRLQLDAYAATPNEADALARAVKDRIDGYRGVMGAVAVQGVFAENARTDYQSDSKLFRSGRDFVVWYAER